MPKLVERYQNPVPGDTVNLRLFVYNVNSLTDIQSVEQVDIYFLDKGERTSINPDGRRLIESFPGTGVVAVDTGSYLLPMPTNVDQYLIGRYLDVWTLNVTDIDPVHKIEQFFDIIPDLWYTTPIPVVYDFNFKFQPNRLRHGSRQYLVIEVIPNVPRASDLKSYYENLAIVAQISINIEQTCGPCVPQEEDLRLVVDNEPVPIREKRFAYYKLDTTEMDCGIYNVWFRLEFGDNTYISDKNQIQIF
jgi:hypothetical protein